MIFEQICAEIQAQIPEDMPPAKARDLGRNAAERVIQTVLAGQDAPLQRRWINHLKADFRDYGYDMVSEFSHQHPARDAWEAVNLYLRRL